MHERIKVGWFAAEGISHYISFAQVIIYPEVVVLNQLEPSSLSKVQIGLSEYILETLVVGKYLALLSNQIVSPDLQSVHHRGQFQIMSRIVSFVLPQLARCIGHHFAILHEYTPKSSSGCVTVVIKTAVDDWKS